MRGIARFEREYHAYGYVVRIVYRDGVRSSWTPTLGKKNAREVAKALNSNPRIAGELYWISDYSPTDTRYPDEELRRRGDFWRGVQRKLLREFGK